MPPIVEPLTVQEITLFTASSKGAGRDTNDARNKRREKILVDGFHGKTEQFFTDATYGAAWSKLATDFRTALVERASPGFTDITVKPKGGRGHNYDFQVVYSGPVATELHVEFKFGGTSVDTLPEFFNPAADKPFHSEMYARFFYKNYLPRIISLYSLTVTITEEAYMKEIHKNSSRAPFFVALKAAEDADAGGPLYKQKAAIAAESITAFLEAQKGTTNLALLTAEFQRSQANKHFLIYNDGKFYHDSIKTTELVAASVAGIRNGNLLVIQSAEPGTKHEMLLRWKNHLGVLLPAWQIRMCRA